jgi:hypothetical protein
MRLVTDEVVVFGILIPKLLSVRRSESMLDDSIVDGSLRRTSVSIFRRRPPLPDGGRQQSTFFVMSSSSTITVWAVATNGVRKRGLVPSNDASNSFFNNYNL